MGTLLRLRVRDAAAAIATLGILLPRVVRAEDKAAPSGTAATHEPPPGSSVSFPDVPPAGTPERPAVVPAESTAPQSPPFAAADTVRLERGEPSRPEPPPPARTAQPPHAVLAAESRALFPRRARLAPNWKLTVDLRVGGGSGRLIDHHSDEMVVVGGTGMLAWKNLEFGVGFTSEVLYSWRFTALSGLLVEPVPWLRIDLLGEGGLEAVGVMGDFDIFTEVRGGLAWLPYLGARGGVSFPLAGSHGVLLGAWVSGGGTMGHATIHPTIEDCFLSCTTKHETHTVGGPSYAFGLRFGVYLR